jgi:hypothetical protein
MFDAATSDLAGIPVATLQQWLLEAQTALHQLSVGSKAETVGYTQGDSSKSVTYTRATLATLQAHITALKRQLGIPSRSRHAITPFF